MGTVYAFFADGFEEIEAFTAVDTLRRAGLNVQIVSVTPDEIVMGAHDVSLLCDINFENCDFFIFFIRNSIFRSLKLSDMF